LATSLESYLEEQRVRVDRALERYLPEESVHPPGLIRAMRYSVFSGGKRLRPALTLAGAEVVGGDPEQVLPVACAIELIHTYSLIHDDLPAIDDDDFRRGRPASHKVFGEAIAILAGDALLTHAFQLMTSPEVLATVELERLLDVVQDVARAAGVEGMVGGQTADVESEGMTPEAALVEYIHTRKTGALIRASVRAGGVLGGGDERQVKALSLYGEKLGFAFQIVDDVLDVEGDAARMGKPTGSDAQHRKVTYPAAVGLAAAKEQARRLLQEATQALTLFGPRAAVLERLAECVVARRH
jgi:geranylgeranyl diphosphate synthase type II